MMLSISLQLESKASQEFLLPHFSGADPCLSVLLQV